MGRWSGFACREDPASEGFVPRSLEQAELRLDLRRTEQGRGAQGGVPRAGYHVACQAAARARCQAAYQGRGDARPGRRLRLTSASARRPLGEEAVGARRPCRRPWLAILVGCGWPPWWAGLLGVPSPEWPGSLRGGAGGAGRSSGPAQLRPLCPCVWTLSVSPVTSVAWCGCGGGVGVGVGVG